ncbi:MAG: hypothetical protein ACK5HP_02950 [Bacilli bacterium]
MNKLIYRFFILIILVYFGFLILINSQAVLSSVSFSFKIWQDSIFPSLFPFFVLSELLIDFGFIELLSKLSKPLMKLFKINSNAGFVFFMSLISGFPSSAKYTKELYLNGYLNELEATKILTFSHFSNPLFILGSVSILFLKNKEVGLLILFCHYFTNFIIALIFRNFYISNYNNLVIIKNNNTTSIGKSINKAIKSSLETLFLILGTITTFLVITTVLNKTFNFNPIVKSILNGTIEMTQGLNYVSILSIPLKIKCILTVMILSFGGFSVHMQILSILSDTKIKYLPFLTARLLHSGISGIMVFILFDIWIKLI